MVVLGALLVSAAAYFVASRFHRPRMTEAQVIQIANAAGVSEGFYLDEYNAPHPQSEYRERDRTWRVMYWSKRPAPWDPPAPPRRSAHGAPYSFFVIVDDRTQRTEVGMLVPVGGTKSNKSKQLPVIPGVMHF